VINWMLEVEDVEDIACTVDDMETRIVRDLWFRGGVKGKGKSGTRRGIEVEDSGIFRVRIDGRVLKAVIGHEITALFGPGLCSGNLQDQTRVLYYCMGVANSHQACVNCDSKSRVCATIT
jgi:hypothetical protein